MGLLLLMAALLFQQEDTVSVCGKIAACTSLNDGNATIDRLCVNGGTAGTGTPQIKINNAPAAPGDRQVYFEMVPGVIDWATGDVVVRLNVVTAAGSLAVWTETHVCRINNGCTNQETLGTLTGQTTDITTTGVKTHTVPIIATTALTDDKLYIILVFDSDGAHGSTAMNITPNQLIDTPIDDGISEGLGIPIAMYHHSKHNQVA